MRGRRDFGVGVFAGETGVPAGVPAERREEEVLVEGGRMIVGRGFSEPSNVGDVD